MTVPRWLSPLARRTRPTRKATTPRRVRARDLSVEHLESRLVPTAHVVQSNMTFATIQAAIDNVNTVNGDGIGGPNADVVNIVYDNQIADTVPITVNRSGKLNFGSSTDTVGNLTIKDSELITVNKHGTVNMNGYSDEVGALNLNGGTIAIGATGTLIVGGPNTFTGPTTISTGVLQLAGGSMPGPLTIGSGATLTGSGSTGPLTFTSGSDFTANVNTLGSNMVSATGPINLNGATLNAVLGTLPALNQTFTFLSSTTAIDGTFAGLANNQTFVAGGHTFRITHGAFNTVFLTFLG